MALSGQLDAARWGVQERYHEGRGRWRAAPPATVESIVRAMSGDGHEESPPPGPVRFVRRDRPGPVDAPSRLMLEDGAEIGVDGRLPPDLPFGYHTLTRLDDGAETTVIAGPGRACLPGNAPAWGWAVQLHSLRSSRSWGMGDLGDLAELGRWSAGELGAGLLLVNPLTNRRPSRTAPDGQPLLPQQPPLPQSALPPGEGDAGRPRSGRRARRPGGRRAGPQLRATDRPGRRSGSRWKPWTGGGGGFPATRASTAPARTGPGPGGLRHLSVLAATRGPGWRNWPDGHRHPDRPEVAAFKAEARGCGPLPPVAGTCRLLGSSPSMLVTAALDDTLTLKERPNMPGTTGEWPNWSIPLPLPLEGIEADPRPRRIAGLLRRQPGSYHQ